VPETPVRVRRLAVSSMYRPSWRAGWSGTNPEQLFAAVYAACFQSSMERFAAGHKLDLSGSRVTARIGIGTLRAGGLGITAALDLVAPGIGYDDALSDAAGARNLSVPRHARQHRSHAQRGGMAWRVRQPEPPRSAVPTLWRPPSFLPHQQEATG
jgi:hypothetical protein